MKRLFVFIALIFTPSAYAIGPQIDSLAVKASNGTAVTVTAEQYAAKDSVGGKIKFPGIYCPTDSFKVRGVKITDAADNAVEYELYLKATAFSGTVTDGAAFDPTDGELPDIHPSINLATTDHFSFSDNGLSSVSSLDSNGRIAVVEDRGRTLYGALITRGTPTYAAATDVAIKLSIQCD